MYNFSCVTCLESLNDVSLPCGSGNNGQAQFACIEKINTSCVYYDGMVFPCAGILQGSKLNDVIANLSTDTSCNTTSCTIMHTLTYSCEEGYVLTYDNPGYTATWFYKHLATGIWESINLDVIESTTKLVPNNLLQRKDVIRDISSFMNADVKVVLQSDDCEDIVLNLPAEEECELLERCDSSLADFAVNATTGQPLYYEIHTSATQLSTTYLDWFRCYFLESTNVMACTMEDFSAIFRERRNAYLKDHAEILIDLQIGLPLPPYLLSPIVNLPPTILPLNWFHDGPFSVENPNFGYVKYPVFMGCGCNVGTTHFKVRYKPQVQNLAALTGVTGVLGELVSVVDEGEFYTWDVNTLSWKIDFTVTDVNGEQFYATDLPLVLGDIETACFSRMRERRNTSKVALNEFILSWHPFVTSALTLPTYLVKRHLDNPMPSLNMSCNCQP